MTLCEKVDCDNEADGMTGVAIFPTKALMEFYRTDQSLTRMIMSLALCAKHRAELKIDEMFPGPLLDNLIRVVEASSGVKVDRDAMKIVRVNLDDPDYLALLSIQAKK